jgi:hypothetical protein
LEIVGCKSAAAVHFLPSFCPIAGLWGCKSGKNCPRRGQFSLSTPQARQTPSDTSRRVFKEAQRPLGDETPFNAHCYQKYSCSRLSTG